MKLLLDTHILIWFAADRNSLSRGEREVLADESVDLLVSAISLWEIRAKVRAERRRGKPLIPIDPSGAVAFCAAASVEIEEITSADYLAPPLANDPVHGDPFDEMLLIHAQRLGARLLTRDGKLRHHPLALSV